MENLTPPANGKTAPPQPCRISSRPAPTTQAQSDTRATCAAALGFFFLPCLHACPVCRISTPARAGCCWQPPRGKDGKYPGSAGHSTRILRPPPAPGKISTASAAPDDHASSRPPPTMTTHQRQRRHRGGQARKRRTPAAACIAAACWMIHPAAPRKTAILPRRRRGQILHLTGYSFASRGKAKRLYATLSIPQPPFFPGLALGCPPRRRRAASAPPTVGGLPDEADGPPRPPFRYCRRRFSAVRVRKREIFLGMRGFLGFLEGGLEKARGDFLKKFLK